MTVFLIALWLAALPAAAQGLREPVAEGEVTFEPQCFMLVNDAPYAMRGSIISNFFTNREGVRARHNMNFRLESGEQQQVCSTGPFYDGRMLYLVLRESLPVFSCLTRVDGPVKIEGYVDTAGRRHTKAVCL